MTYDFMRLHEDSWNQAMLALIWVRMAKVDGLAGPDFWFVGRSWVGGGGVSYLFPIMRVNGDNVHGR